VRRRATRWITELVNDPNLLHQVDSVLKFWERINTIFERRKRVATLFTSGFLRVFTFLNILKKKISIVWDLDLEIVRF